MVGVWGEVGGRRFCGLSLFVYASPMPRHPPRLAPRTILLIVSILWRTGLAQSTLPTPVAGVKAPGVPQWQTAAGGKMEFEVASVRRDISDTNTPPNFAITSDDGWGPSSDLFTADFPLMTYIEFAYKSWLTPSQREAILSKLPGWVTTDKFEIRARASGNPTKDQMRLMMQSLLADRFKLKIHFETRQEPVLALTAIKPGKLGASLRPHAQGPPCEGHADTTVDGTAHNGDHAFPPRCGVYSARMTGDNTVMLASRDTTLAQLAASLPNYGTLDRPVVDQTNIRGRFDVTIEWTARVVFSNAPSPAENQPNLGGTTFSEALADQLGLKLKPAKAPLRLLIIDHVEMPTGN